MVLTMKIETKIEKENPFLNRKELEFIIDHPSEKTPSKAAVQQFVAKETGNEIEKTEIRKIFTLPGFQKSRCIVFVWKDKKVPDLSKPVEKKEEIKTEEQKIKEEKK